MAVNWRGSSCGESFDSISPQLEESSNRLICGNKDNVTDPGEANCNKETVSVDPWRVAEDMLQQMSIGREALEKRESEFIKEVLWLTEKSAGCHKRAVLLTEKFTSQIKQVKLNAENLIFELDRERQRRKFCICSDRIQIPYELNHNTDKVEPWKANEVINNGGNRRYQQSESAAQLNGEIKVLRRALAGRNAKRCDEWNEKTDLTFTKPDSALETWACSSDNNCCTPPQLNGNDKSNAMRRGHHHFRRRRQRNDFSPFCIPNDTSCPIPHDSSSTTFSASLSYSSSNPTAGLRDSLSSPQTRPNSAPQRLCDVGCLHHRQCSSFQRDPPHIPNSKLLPNLADVIGKGTGKFDFGSSANSHRSLDGIAVPNQTSMSSSEKPLHKNASPHSGLSTSTSQSQKTYHFSARSCCALAQPSHQPPPKKQHTSIQPLVKINLPVLSEQIHRSSATNASTPLLRLPLKPTGPYNYPSQISETCCSGFTVSPELLAFPSWAAARTQDEGLSSSSFTSVESELSHLKSSKVSKRKVNGRRIKSKSENYAKEFREREIKSPKSHLKSNDISADPSDCKFLLDDLASKRENLLDDSDASLSSSALPNDSISRTSVMSAPSRMLYEAWDVTVSSSQCTPKVPCLKNWGPFGNDYLPPTFATPATTAGQTDDKISLSGGCSTGVRNTPKDLSDRSNSFAEVGERFEMSVRPNNGNCSVSGQLQVPKKSSKPLEVTAHCQGRLRKTNPNEVDKSDEIKNESFRKALPPTSLYGSLRSRNEGPETPRSTEFICRWREPVKCPAIHCHSLPKNTSASSQSGTEECSASECQSCTSMKLTVKLQKPPSTGSLTLTYDDELRSTGDACQDRARGDEKL